MPPTILLSGTINWAQTFTRLQPLTGVGGVDTEPAVTIANTVKQFILAPPFAWAWNRTTATFTTTASVQDYSQSLSTYGWLEKAVVSSAAGTYEAEVKMLLPDAAETGRPVHVAPYLDDGAGNITFRMYPVPDGIYTVKLIFQNAAPMFTALSQTWSPLPDKLLYLYSSGFLAHALEQIDDQRFPTHMQLFMRQLVAANAGLLESEKNIFLSEKLVSARQQQSELLGVQQGRQARG